ncbi:diacylglycerol kinase family protein [Radiobacillus deserti]|uniref:Diacylglycerol kinase family protein n=1 Tax=Radiobacillus deserti TaxID=2594883 RepID=A0A516KGW9_9BACI|nr:diacylglycerol kinase family protein [Radiobacillus deserti]QDP40642.1 diacylglycerol kinase family protein [Radiobacillus deserti]
MHSDYRGSSHRFWKGFVFAWNGIRSVFRTERNFRVHMFCTGLVILGGIVFHITKGEWMLLSLIIALVLSLEMVNTAIEKIMDYLSTEPDPKIGAIKDIAAGAVFVSAISAAVIGGFIFIPRIVEVFL